MIHLFLQELWSGRMEILRAVVLVAIILVSWNLGAWVERRKWRRDPARLNVEARERLRDALADVERYKTSNSEAVAMSEELRRRLRVGTSTVLEAAMLLGGEPTTKKEKR